jgi:micrococcal nuclease
MKVYKIIISLIFALILTLATFAQQRMNGKVVNVIDGKTVVIELDTRKTITAELDFIEVPETEQQLSQTVKDHLQNMLMGKIVDFYAKGITKTNFVGKMYLGDVDVSQQMLRDGAAWYAVSEQERQNTAEKDSYKLMESQAKLEKRGVWGIANLQTPWAFRAEKAKIEKVGQVQQIAVAEEVKEVKVPIVKVQPKVVARQTIWADVRGANPKAYLGVEGLFNGKNAETGIDYIYTKESDLTLKTKARSIEKLELVTVYAYKGNSQIIEKNVYVFGILSTSKKYEFVKLTPLTIQIGKQQIAAKPLVRFFADADDLVQELLVYQVDAATLEKLHRAENVSLKLGTIGATVNNQSKTMIANLLKVTN